MKKTLLKTFLSFAIIASVFLSQQKVSFASGGDECSCVGGVYVNGGPNSTCAQAGQSCQNTPLGLGGIKNNAIAPSLGGDPAAANSGATFTTYFVIIWQGLIVVGTLAMLFNLVNGALEWVTAGGESEKVKHARMKMTEGVVGLIILTGSFAAVMFIGQIFHFNVLKFTIPSPF